MDIEMPRNDAEFNLDTVSNKEIFDGLKAGMFECLQAVEHLEEISPEDIEFKEDSFRNQFMGADGYLYPKICICTRTMPKKNWIFATNADFIVTPFTIQMLLLNNGIKVVESKNLTAALVEFMNNRFPNSNYEAKRNKYLKDCDLRRRMYDQSVFEIL